MLHLKKKKLSPAGLTAFSVSVLDHAAVLLLLTHCCGGQFQVVGPPQPVVVLVGDDVTLPCHLKPAGDAAALTFEWARLDLNPRFVHVWHEHQDLHVNQHPSYKGRTSVSVNKLKLGDVSLILSKVKLSDEGTYRCYFPDSDKDSTVQLVVGAASPPVLTLSGMDRDKGGVVLDCESRGWYPEPEVLWLDAEGTLLSAGPTETFRGPDDLYTVSSRVTVEKRHSNSFTCRVHQKSTTQTRDAHITVPDDFFVAPCSSAACISISLVACFTCILAVGLSVWRRRRNKTMKAPQREAQQLMKEREEREERERKMTEIAEKLKRKEEEHEHMMSLLKKQTEELKEETEILKEQRDELKKQRDKLNDQQEKMESLVEDTEMKFQSVKKDLTEKEKDGGRRLNSEQGCIKLEGIISLYRWGLTDRQKDLKLLVLETEKLIENTEKVIVGTTDEKEEAQRHMDEDGKHSQNNTS